MSITAEDVSLAFGTAEVLLDEALPLLGQAELVPLADLLTTIGQKVAAAIAARGAATPTLAAEVAAADAAADLAEKAKYP